MIGFDYIGFGTCVSAIAAAIVSIVVALRQTGTHAQISDVRDQLEMSNGATVGQVIEANDMTAVGGHPEPHIK